MLSISSYCLAQSDTVGVRIGPYESNKTGINYYNYSELNKVNIEVSIWGGVKNPGKYLVVRGTKLVDLITLAGGPSREGNLASIKLVRSNSSGKESVSVYNMDKVYEKNSLYGFEGSNIMLNPNDVIILPITPEKTFTDYLQIVGTILAPIVSIITLIVTLSK
ncbi:hypothetical protein BH10BAC5_BH10BAC5_11110 [soil metagenome]